MTDQTKKHEIRSVPAAIGADGSIVEMIYRAGRKETALLSWREGELTEATELDVPGVGLVRPYTPDNNLLTHGVVLFPSAAEEYESISALTESIRAFIHRYVDLSETFEEIVVHYVLLSWIFDAFDVIGLARCRGDYGTGKSRALQVIGSICYRPMFAAGASSVSSIFRVCDLFKGTLVLDEADFRSSDERSDIVKILNCGYAKGFPILRSEQTPTKEYNPRAFDVFGPKLVASRREFDDQALESRCITEMMSGLPPRADIPLALPENFHAEAQCLRNQLLMYRFQNFDAERDLTKARATGLESRVSQVFAPLVAVAETEDAKQRILEVARAHTGKVHAERSLSIEAQLLTVLFSMRQENRTLTIGDIATTFAAEFRADYERPLTARWIGAQLRKRLGLIAEKSNGTFVIPETENQKLKKLFTRYEIESLSTEYKEHADF